MMQLVGATYGFIMKPFVKTYMLQGLIASIITLILMTVILYGAVDYLPVIDFSTTNTDIIIIYISMLILSLLLTSFSTIFSMRRYLNADIDKFYM